MKVRRRRFVLGSVPALPRTSGRGSQRAMGTWVLRESRSKSAKAFRTLGKSLQQAVGDAEAQCILVTSAQAGEGKSVAVANVAVALAQMGTKVLVVDANYAHPSQHVLLSDILSMGEGGAGGPDELSPETIESGKAAVRTQLETLRVLPAWPKPADPESILQSSALREYLRHAATNNELVLIDAPALAECDQLDAMKDLCDGVVLVTSAAGGEEEVTQAAKSALRRVDLRSVGIIVSSIPPVGGPAASKVAAFRADSNEE
jgi:Mrp family chromosome partitioning ATPase